MPTAEGNVGVAFALVCGAGASTAIGAAVVFFPSLVKLASRRVLAASLGVSAGVMTYVSFVEIFVKSVIGFRASMVTDDMTDDEILESENRAFVYASASFFGGVVVMIVSSMQIIMGRACIRQPDSVSDTPLHFIYFLFISNCVDCRLFGEMSKWRTPSSPCRRSCHDE